jgi:hypothetical protein
MRSSIRKFAALGCVAMLAGCEGDPTGSAGDPEALASAQERWSAQDINDYRMTIRLQGGMIGGSARITVQNGQTVSIQPLAPGALPASAFQHLDTVEELFDILVSAHDDDAYRIDAEYHPQLGVPMDVLIDPEKNAVDEEHGFKVDIFEIL